MRAEAFEKELAEAWQGTDEDVTRASAAAIVIQALVRGMRARDDMQCRRRSPLRWCASAPVSRSQ